MWLLHGWRLVRLLLCLHKNSASLRSQTTILVVLFRLSCRSCDRLNKARWVSARSAMRDCEHLSCRSSVDLKHRVTLNFRLRLAVWFLHATCIVSTIASSSIIHRCRRCFPSYFRLHDSDIAVWHHFTMESLPFGIAGGRFRGGLHTCVAHELVHLARSTILILFIIIINRLRLKHLHTLIKLQILVFDLFFFLFSLLLQRVAQRSLHFFIKNLELISWSIFDRGYILGCVVVFYFNSLIFTSALPCILHFFSLIILCNAVLLWNNVAHFLEVMTVQPAMRPMLCHHSINLELLDCLGL